MGLFSLFRQYTTKRGGASGSNGSGDEARILMLGLDNSGKTSILQRLTTETQDSELNEAAAMSKTEEVAPTQGFNVKSIRQDGMSLKLWDIGGQVTLRQYWRHYFNGVGVLIYVVDSTDEVRMEESAMELIRLLREEKLATTPLIILANKQDLFSALDVNEIIDIFELTSRINDDRVWTIQPCSAVTGDGIDEGMEWIMDRLVERNEQEANVQGEDQE